MTAINLPLFQISICLINVIGGIKFLIKREIFKRELIFIVSFCIIDFITSLLGILDLLNIISNTIGNFSFLIFICAEIILLPAYTSSIIGTKHSWTLPISIVISSLLISFFYFELVATTIQLFSAIFISIYCLRYLKWYVTNANNQELNISISFWIIMGIMVCYTASIPSCIGYFLLKILGNSPRHAQFAGSIIGLFILLNIFMHVFFIKAFTWKPEQQ